MSKRDVNESWADYLRRVMTEAGYDPDGIRSGGRTRLAEDSGVSLPVISRSLNEGRTPDPSTLRALVRPLNKPYRELLIAAGHATEEELPDPAVRNPRREGEVDRRSVAELIEAGEAPLLSIDPEALRGLTEEQQAVVIREAQEHALRTARLLRGER